jgi:hypothetical protein
MTRQFNRISILGQGNDCPKCKRKMQRRGHKFLGKKQKNAPYYFSQWDYCLACWHLQHYDEYKVWNNNDMAKYVKSKEEESNLLDIMKNF